MNEENKSLEPAQNKNFHPNFGIPKENPRALDKLVVQEQKFDLAQEIKEIKKNNFVNIPPRNPQNGNLNSKIQSQKPPIIRRSLKPRDGNEAGHQYLQKQTELANLTELFRKSTGGGSSSKRENDKKYKKKSQLKGELKPIAWRKTSSLA